MDKQQRTGGAAAVVAGPGPGPGGVAGTRPASGAARRKGGIKDRQGWWGWLFVSPMVVVLGLFLLLPILMAAVGEPAALERAVRPVHLGARTSSACATTPTCSAAAA